MAIGKDKIRLMTTIPKTLEALIRADAIKSGVHISEQIALILKIHYQQSSAYPQQDDTKPGTN